MADKIYPLSHHEILGIIAPFVRRGRHVDLGNSDRVLRRLAFKPINHGDHPQTGFSENLLLENPSPGHFRLTRQVANAHGLSATLLAEGADPGELLDRVEAVAPHAHFRFAAGVPIAISYIAEAGAGAARAGKHLAGLAFARGQALVGGLHLTLVASGSNRQNAGVLLEPAADSCIDLPADLLAVLGSEWGLLSRKANIWQAALRLRAVKARRAETLERELEKLVAHLTTVLAKPPAAFHETLLRARWAVTFRRARPVLVFAALMACGVCLRYVTVVPDSAKQVLSMMLPPALMVICFSMPELPRFEIPPLPRRLADAAWQSSAILPGSAGTEAASR